MHWDILILLLFLLAQFLTIIFCLQRIKELKKEKYSLIIKMHSIYRQYTRINDPLYIPILADIRFLIDQNTLHQMYPPYPEEDSCQKNQ